VLHIDAGLALVGVGERQAHTEGQTRHEFSHGHLLYCTHVGHASAQCRIFWLLDGWQHSGADRLIAEETCDRHREQAEQGGTGLAPLA
jgi:hypothetical protein